MTYIFVSFLSQFFSPENYAENNKSRCYFRFDVLNAIHIVYVVGWSGFELKIKL